MRPMPILVGVLALVAGTLALRPLFVEAAVGGIVHDEGTGPRPDSDPGRLGSEGAEPRPVATSVREPLEAPAGHPNRPAGQALRIRVVDSNGIPVAGQAAWEFCDGHPLCGLPLDWERGSKIPMTEGKPRGHDGHLDIEAPSGAWTWLRVRADPPQLGEPCETYALVPPWAEEREVRLVGTHYAIPVFVLAKGLAGNLPDGEVQLWRSPLDGQKPIELVGTGRTGSQGQLRFEGLTPGSYVVCAPGAGRGARPPHAEKVVLGGPAGRQEHPVVVQQAEPVARIDLQVDSTIVPVSAPMPVLYARSLDDDDLVPMQGTIRAGKQTVHLELRDGVYELALLPGGIGRIENDDTMLEVKDGHSSRSEILLVPLDRKVEVELVGLDFKVRGVHCWFRSEDGLHDENRRLLFHGPWTWNVRKLDIPLAAERGRWVVWDQGHVWLSKQVFDTDAVVHRVELEPATRLQVRWRGEDALMRGPTHLVVTSRHGSCARVQAKVLAPVDGRRVAMRLGTCVVPRGPVQVDCVDDTTGESLWTRDVMAKETWLDVDV
ncbi:MAG: hypothetical protein R3F30_06235 [Planctomycetota bacterium]